MGMALLGCSAMAFAQQLAFPEARGWGRFATGARNGGSVYHVTNLNDSGTGSLRDAVSQPNRIVVFDVAGVINLGSGLVFKNNQYIAGQTAPGEGITVYGNRVSFSGASNIIVRHMRFRMGHKGDSGKDCAGIANGTDMIFDHCSFSWGLDETFSINSDGKGTTPKNFTLQNCVIGQGLLTHSAGGLMQGDSITLYRNLYVDNSTRNNKVKGRNQYVNNIVYNWQNGCYIMGGDSEGQSYCNIESNLFINGPAKGGSALGGGNANFHFYGDDNWQDSNMDGVLDPQLLTTDGGSDRQSVPYPYPELEKWPGNELVAYSLPTVGASLPYRDMADCYMIDEVMSFGLKGALIANEETLVYGAPNTWKVYAGVKKQDTDGDGMPDVWETANGTNPSKNDAMQIAANGYTNIENYINSITVDDRDFFLRVPVALEQLKSTTTTMQIGWRDYTYAEDGFAVEVKQGDGPFAEVARTAANATTCTLTGLEPGTKYSVRVRAFAGEQYSDYTAVVDMSTRPVEVGIIDLDTYEPDLVWGSSQTSFDSEAEAKSLLINSPDDVMLTLSETVQPKDVVVNSPAHVTIEGVGAIGGTASMNKGGEGTLTLNTLNTYTGATVLHDGVLEFNTLKNGGVASAIGQSVEFAQNWLFDGGTYCYTGASTSTNRAAKLMRETEFAVANKSATVTMNGTFEGSAPLAIGGQGQVTIATEKFFGYTGATILRGGSLYLSTPAIASAGIGSSSKLVMAGGHLKTKGESSGYETYSFPIEVVEGTTSQLSPNRNCYLNNTLTGSGTLQLNIPYLREYVKWNTSNFTGRIVANGISSEKEGSLFLLNTGIRDMSTCVVELRGNARVTSWETNAEVTLGGLSGIAGTYLSGSSKQTNNFKCTWTVGAANSDETFRGIINNWSAGGSGHSGTVSIVKVGTGVWRLTGANEYSGTTQVKAGRLVVNGAHSGTGQVSVMTGGELAGKGSVAGRVAVFDGSILVAGDTLINGTGLTLNNGLSMKAGSVLQCPIYCNGTSSKANRITLKGNVDINDAVLYVDMNDVSSIPDDRGFVLLSLGSATVTGTGFTQIIPERPSPTQEWDTSLLLSKGQLFVRASVPDGIRDLQSVSRDDAPCYDLTGRRVPATSKGLYIQNGKKVMR